MESETLQLLTPAPEEKLIGWLEEFYGKPVQIARRKLLRHRDLSFVERLWIDDALPETLIYKLVLPPWDVEQDLHERVLVPCISNSATLYLSAHHGNMTAMFMEDLGTQSLLDYPVDAEFAAYVGKELAKLQRAYTYRIEELMSVNVLRSLLPRDYVGFTQRLSDRLRQWDLLSAGQEADLVKLAGLLAKQLADEPVSLVHGDMYAENLLVRGERLCIIDWSWFTMVGVPVMDLASLTSTHFKNADFARWRDVVLDAYCFESGRAPEAVLAAIPYAETLSRLLFLDWLVERRGRGILGTTVGPVDDLIAKLVGEISQRHAALRAS